MSDAVPIPRGRVLVAGWFSFEEVIATVGDRLGAEVVQQWLRTSARECDVAYASYLDEGVDWRHVDPDDYSLLVFTTGPLMDNALLDALLDRFSRSTRWAVDVSVLDTAIAARFDRVWARDGAGPTRPDIAFASLTEARPVIATAYAPQQPEYPDGRHDTVARTVREWLPTRELATVDLDMDLFAEHRYRRLPSQVESLIARVDVVVSMRLHGMVLALKHDVPVVALDPVAGGGKISHQAEALGWPCVLRPDAVSASRLDDALGFCLRDDVAQLARRCREAALGAVRDLADDIARALDA